MSGETATGQVMRGTDFKGLPTWYFPIMGCLAGVFDVARAYPAVYWVIPIVLIVNLTLTLTVLRTRMRLMRALWKNKRTRFLAVGLVAVRFAVRAGLGALGFALGTAAGGVAVGTVMAVLGTAMGWGDQWVILRTLRRSEAKARTQS
ncbi:hypothetical protein [Streptomyces longispororuber]|uniref:hypothetical protein n=1 Tax=Streptomyces longispororuber TaxID=68230 RepID=UPI002108FF80|nr:hypothetical protein [Streptomyces longispororuber]MCQ4207854.1 hypothetical protein [Streptomyces longispororuber]